MGPATVFDLVKGGYDWTSTTIDGSDKSRFFSGEILSAGGLSVFGIDQAAS